MKIKSRKEIRKELRKAKKIKKHESFLKWKAKVKQDKNNSQSKKSKGEFKKNNNVTEKKPAGKKHDGIGVAKGGKNSLTPKFGRREFKTPQERFDNQREREKREKEKLDEEIKKARIERLKADNVKEEIEIKKLEKQIKLKKGKSKAFVLDGLDYLLDVCDKKISENEFEKTLQESDSEFESDLENIVGESCNKISKSKKKSEEVKSEEDDSEDIEDIVSDADNSTDENFYDEEYDEDSVGESSADDIQNDINCKKGVEELPEKKIMKPNKKGKNKKRKLIDEETTKTKKLKVTFKEIERSSQKSDDDDESNNEVVDDDGNDDEDDDNDDEEDDDNDDDENKNINSTETKKLWEDIYGRTRDKAGNVIKTYVPPQLRQKTDNINEKQQEKLQKLRKQLKGLLNRLTENNMTFISKQVEELYMANSRNDMNETLSSLFQDLLFTEVLTPEKLIMEHAMLVAVLHANIGSEIGGHFLQNTVLEFKNALDSDLSIDNKKINNILIFIMHLYNFKLFHSKLMYDITNELIKNLEEKQIELLLLTLRTVGFNLRKDDPIALKNLVLNVQEKANQVSNEENNSRLKFMLEVLMAIKNNNMSKIPNYNPETVERLRKSLKVFVRKGNYSTELNISLQDLLNAEKHGRWWIVGSAWSGAAPSNSASDKAETEGSASTKFSQKLLDLARKQRMNTDVRRNIFCILMSSEDFLEAFERLIKLKLKGSVEREIVNVILHCALQEKNFNPYYMYLANKFCTFDRKYQIMLQCAVWDKIKEIQNMSPIQITNLAKFVGKIILEKGLPISILKVIQFSELDKKTIKFVRQVLLAILLSEDRNAAIAVFKRISDSAKLKLFRESLRLFLQHFLLKSTKKIDKEEFSKLVEMVEVAEQTLTPFNEGTMF